jgi:hypothetical protein
MSMTDSSRRPTVPAPPFASPGASENVHQCDECGAPVDIEQRYCVACGAHRRHVNDPAARYLSEATARARTRKAVATAQRASGAPGIGRSRGLALALAIALIPVAAAAGVLEGRSSNSQDARLIQALSHRQAAPATTTVSAGAAPSAAIKSAAAKTRPPADTRHRTARKASAASSKNAGKVLSKTRNGTAAQITGFKPSQSQVQQGAAETKKIQKSTGKSYVGGQSQLPSQVVVP